MEFQDRLQEAATVNMFGKPVLSGGPDGPTGRARVSGTVPQPSYTPAVYTYPAQRIHTTR